MSKALTYISIAVVVILLGLGAYSYFSPELHLRQVRTAAKNQDTERLRELIDFESVKSRLKEDIRVRMVSSLESELSGNPFAGFAMLLTNVMIDTLVETVVTAPALASIFDRGYIFLDPEEERREQEALQENRVQPGTSDRQNVVIEGRYDSYRRYRVTLRPGGEAALSSKKISMYLRRQGFASWKISRIVIPMQDAKSDTTPEESEASSWHPQPVAMPADEYQSFRAVRRHRPSSDRIKGCVQLMFGTAPTRERWFAYEGNAVVLPRDAFGVSCADRCRACSNRAQYSGNIDDDSHSGRTV